MKNLITPEKITKETARKPLPLGMGSTSSKRNFLKITRLARSLGKARHYALHDCRSLVSLLGLCSHCHSTKVVRFVMKLLIVN